MLKKSLMGLVGVALCVGLVGCASNSKGSKHGNKGGSSYGAATQGIGEETNFADQDQTGRSKSDLMATRIYHFGFDRFDVSEDDYPSIQAHADYLANHPNSKIRIEGNTDERGSREYNIALGERRAKAVKEILLSSGVKANQIATVSYGAEKPVVRESNEYAFAQNRRSEVVYEE